MVFPIQALCPKCGRRAFLICSTRASCLTHHMFPQNLLPKFKEIIIVKLKLYEYNTKHIVQEQTSNVLFELKCVGFFDFILISYNRHLIYDSSFVYYVRLMLSFCVNNAPKFPGLAFRVLSSLPAGGQTSSQP